MTPTDPTPFRGTASAPADAAPLVLASKSPRRADLLRMLGVAFEVLPAGLEEVRRSGEPPAAYAERTAREKASAVAARRPGNHVIAADTIVVVDGDVLGKPADQDEAVAMLLRLQGREHGVQTGVAVAAPDGAVVGGVETASVRFRPFDRSTAAAYAATGEPLDKAGAYGIQGRGAALVESIDGDFFAVMGLPIVRALRLLEATGWRYQFGVAGAVDAR
ncbi:MAG TPA: Maf family protein [Longimicrobiales bacterium]|nr:Maf family protein [Longimicrobiales bacterium]